MTVQDIAASQAAPLKIACIGGGPAGLYFALLMKKQNPAHDITVYERNRPYDTFGWGVVFSDQTLQNLAESDRETKAEILEALAYWDDIDIHFKDSVITSGGHGFCGIERKQLLNILQARCEDLGVKLVFEKQVDTLDEYADCDLIIACDGLNSQIRTRFADHFKPSIDVRTNRFTWLGTHKLFEAFTFLFKETQWGWFQVHAYRFNKTTSTFIVEAPEEVWRAAGIEDMSQEDGIAFCENLFAEWLDGNKLMSNSAHLRGSAAWINFPRVNNETWIKDNIVLMGDAAHTAHYSIGSGTKLAMEDAISLAKHFEKMPGAAIPDVLTAYEEERKIEVLRIQSSARNSTQWFEDVARYTHLEPEQFAYSLLTRSQRVSHENLRLRDKSYLENFESWYDKKTGARSSGKPIPPMFTPFSLRGMTLKNRVVVSPMCMYSANDGMPNEFHKVHLGSRAMGGAGLVFAEMTNVTRDGRISPGCAGLWNDQQADAWAGVVEFVHTNSTAKIGIQLGHAGRKASTRIGWEGDNKPLEQGNWPIMAASPIPWSPDHQTPREVSRDDMDKLLIDYVAATKRAQNAGFDIIELHAAHGYLLSGFLSPLSNQRGDNYGDSLENRLRFPLEVMAAMRSEWPGDKPISVRISATDWHPDGITEQDSVEIARAFAKAGADLIDVSAGQTSAEAKPVYGRMFQTPFADRIRNETGIATMAVGNIYEPDHVNSIIAAGRADLTALARAHLADPYWTLHAAASLGYDAGDWPNQYRMGRTQYLRNLERQQQEIGAV